MLGFSYYACLIIGHNIGMVGASLAEKVQEAYAFIAQWGEFILLMYTCLNKLLACSNYRPGDEVRDDIPSVMTSTDIS